MAYKPKADNPYYCRPLSPRHTHRAHHHDYRRPARYLITLKKSPSLPPLSLVTGNPTHQSGPIAPTATPTLTGQCFEKALSRWLHNFPQIRMAKAVTMPDHIHLCIEVLDYLPSGLSRALALLMGYATKELITAYPQIGEQKFFQKGFTDSIAYTAEQFDRQKQYVADNPRRLLIKRLHPDLFFRRWMILVADLHLMALGNIFLLRKPHLQIVRFSRRYSPEEVEANRKAWENCVENDGVLISPFIHPIENEMRKRASQGGGNVIRIMQNGFGEGSPPPRPTSN